MPAAALAEVVHQAGWKVVPLDLAAVTDQAGFMDRATKALGLPEFAGRNWQAFRDACGDIGWGPEVPGRLPVVVGRRDYAKARPKERKSAQQVLASAAGRRQQYDSTLAVVLTLV
ncbi:barstar family protein [Streptomyces griseoluteus]|uniref:barstar family protein n=1 Tax=Streptomyces griseoluteus TaxID=29306 RepID=UPI0036C70DD4